MKDTLLSYFAHLALGAGGGFLTLLVGGFFDPMIGGAVWLEFVVWGVIYLVFVSSVAYFVARKNPGSPGYLGLVGGLLHAAAALLFAFIIGLFAGVLTIAAALYGAYTRPA